MARLRGRRRWRQSYGPLLFQHADSGNWQKLTIPSMAGDYRSSPRITPTANHSVATAIPTRGIYWHRLASRRALPKPMQLILGCLVFDSGVRWVASASMPPPGSSPKARKRCVVATMNHLKSEHAIEADGTRHIVGGQRDGTDALDHHGMLHLRSRLAGIVPTLAIKSRRPLYDDHSCERAVL